MKSCKDVHRLVIVAQDRKLSLLDRIAVQMHLVMCSACRRFDAQIVLLRRALQRFPGE